jgi:hypothetical protein
LYNDQNPLQFPIQPLLTPIFAKRSECRWGMDLWLALLTTLTHDSWLTRNCTSLTGLRTPQIPVTAAHRTFCVSFHRFPYNWTKL